MQQKGTHLAGLSLAIIVGVALVTVVYVIIIMACLIHVNRWVRGGGWRAANRVGRRKGGGGLETGLEGGRGVGGVEDLKDGR